MRLSDLENVSAVVGVDLTSRFLVNDNSIQICVTRQRKKTARARTVMRSIVVAVAKYPPPPAWELKSLAPSWGKKLHSIENWAREGVRR